MKKGAKVFGLIVILLIIGSAFVGVVSAEEISIDTEISESRFTTDPPRELPYEWWYAHDHLDSSPDGWFDTKAYPPGQGNGNFWYTFSFPEVAEYKGIWETSLPYSGNYEVFVRIPSPDPFDPNLDEYVPPNVYLPTQVAKYKIFHKTEVDIVTIDQDLNKGRFTSLGVFDFGTTAKVELTNNQDEFWRSVAFDAVKFVPVVAVHGMAVTNVYTTPPSPNVGQSTTIHVTVKNEGSQQENDVPVKAYVDGYQVCSAQYVTLSARKSTTKSFTWTPSTAKTYSVKGEVGIVSGETDTSDNKKTISVSVQQQNQPPTCAIELRRQGTTTTIDEIGVGEFFDIYVGDSTDDQGIKEVRFSSDDFQDGNPTGAWTGWDDWDTSSEDWNAISKTKAWLFTTEGRKEVWAELKDNEGQASSCYANIYAGDLIEIEVDKQGLFGVDVGFKNNDLKDYIVRFTILDTDNEVLDVRHHMATYPSFRKISENLFELPNSKHTSLYLIFDPLKKEDLEALTDININVEYLDGIGNVERNDELPLHFEEYSSITATNFDMTKDSYDFSNNDWPGDGKCYGMAATSILYFNGKLSLPNDKENTFSLEMEEATPNIELYQKDFWLNKFNNFMNKLPFFADNILEEDEYNNLKGTISSGEPLILFLAGGVQDDDGDHAVVVYKVVEDESKSYLLIYDNILPYYANVFGAFCYVTYDFGSDVLSYKSYTKFKLVEVKKDPWYKRIKIFSAGELRVYDTQGRVSGILKLNISMKW
jgi:hypothetical protein